MITYELCMLLRVMPKPELRNVVKRIATTILEKPGIIRKIEHLGTRETPYKISMHGLVHRQATCYLMEFHAPPSSIEDLLEEYARDVDIIRRRIYKKPIGEAAECTLEEELQPPPYRKEVQDLIAESKKLRKPKFKYNSGLDHYPFQK